MLNHGHRLLQHEVPDAILSLSKTAAAHSDLRSAYYYLIDETRPKNKKNKKNLNINEVAATSGPRTAAHEGASHVGASLRAPSFVRSSTHFSSVHFTN